jgi:hypothetical protein
MNSKTAMGALLVLILLCLAFFLLRGDRGDEPTPQAAEPAAAGGTPEATGAAAQKPDTRAPNAPLPALTREDVYIFIEGLLKPELPVDVRVWTAGQLARAEVEEEAVNDAQRAILDDPEPEVAAAAAAALAKRGALPPESAVPSASPDAGGAAPPGMRVETLD